MCLGGLVKPLCHCGKDSAAWGLRIKNTFLEASTDLGSGRKRSCSAPPGHPPPRDVVRLCPRGVGGELNIVILAIYDETHQQWDFEMDSHNSYISNGSRILFTLLMEESYWEQFGKTKFEFYFGSGSTAESWSNLPG